MKLYKKSDRVFKTRDFLKGLREGAGLESRELEEFSKWKEIESGRLQVKLTIFEITNKEGMKFYILSDSLNRVACEVQRDLNEVKGWLRDHGYKTTHDWYIEAYGMSEETWKIWNGESEE